MLRLGLALILCLSAAAFGQQTRSGWLGYGGDAQHSALFVGQSQSLSRVHWRAPMDDDPSYYDGIIFAHYASPAISPANTAVYSLRTTTKSDGQPDYDNWNIVGVNAADGQRTFLFPSDYRAAVVFPNGWTTIMPFTLVQLSNHFPSEPERRVTFSSTALAVAGADGSIFVRTSVDSPRSDTNRYVFYTSLQDFNANYASYAGIKIVTPLTSDRENNVYFGYEADSTVPASLGLGTGGVAKVDTFTGASTFRSVQSLHINPRLQRPAYSSAPALSADGSSLYQALYGVGGCYLVKVSTSDLALTAKVLLMDPTVPGAPAVVGNQSSAAPTIGPDGHVFFGVFRYNWGEGHGMLLQFDENLRPTDSVGKTFPPGSFGSDDTPSVVPSDLVPSYHGRSGYLLLCKYNNYDDNDSDPMADGSNKTALVDPSSDSVTRDRQSGIPVMNEILTVLAPTKAYDDPNHPNARREWCINSAVVDANKKGAILTSEDGRVYRWSFVTNTLTQSLTLQTPTVEAYTSTVIGPDGTVYATDNTALFAIGY